MTRRAAIYARISKVPGGGTSLGVRRQEKDCRSLAERKGWEVAEVLVDDDISAYRPGKRPSYARLVHGIKAGTYDAVVVYDLDRLHRHPWELEEFFRTCDAAGLSDLASVAGDYDLGTNDGRLMARIMGAVAKKESDDKSRRLRRKHEELAESGRWHGGNRPYGYLPIGDGRLEVVPVEAAIIAEAARRVLAGEAIGPICNDLEARKVRTTRGGRWRPATMRQILTGPAVAGRRLYRGEVGGSAEWSPILDEVTWRRLRAVIFDPARARSRAARRYLLTGGIARCGREGCGAALRAQVRTIGGPAYLCTPPPYGDGCGHLSCVAEPLEGLVIDRLFAYVDGEAFSRTVSDSDAQDDESAIMATIAADESQLVELAEMWGRSEIGRSEWLAARRSIDGRLEEARREQAATARARGLDIYAGNALVLSQAWDTLTLDQKRAIVRAAIDTVVVSPSRRQGPSFNPDRVKIVWRE